jgi:DNA (cytosine-5)-methyltransferase 1
VPKYYEFFAGGGMVRAGLGSRWKCIFANDFDANKVATYAANWSEDQLLESDVNAVTISDLPGKADLAWASFPCQDLSCAGNGLGIGVAEGDIGTRSGTFWAFARVLRGLKRADRKPKIVVLENVLGLLTTNSGSDFRSVLNTLCDLGYRSGAIVVDARHFVPQSRPRLFIICVAENVRLPGEIVSEGPSEVWHSDPLIKAHGKLSDRTAKSWIWFDLGKAPSLSISLNDIVVERPVGVEWHKPAETKRLIAMMSKIHKRKLSEAKKTGKRMVATLSLRMRPEGGKTVQRAEISFGGLAGCLRTPKGGGSRPRVLVVRGADVRSRLLSPKEAAGLMGLSRQYRLPEKYEAAFKVIGDGIAVPVVKFVRDRILNAILSKPVSGAVGPPRKTTGRTGGGARMSVIGANRQGLSARRANG